MKVLLYEQNITGHNPSWMYCTGLACLKDGCELVLAARDCPEVNDWIRRLGDRNYERVQVDDLGKSRRHLRDAIGIAIEKNCDVLLFPYLDMMLMELRSVADLLDGRKLDIGGIFFRPLPHASSPFDYLKLAFLKCARTRAAKMDRRALRNAIRQHRSTASLRHHAEQGNEIRILSLDSDAHNAQLHESYPFAHIGRLKSDPSLSKSELSKMEARRKHQLPEDKFIFMHCGIDGIEKGLNDAYMAWSKLPENVRSKTVFLRAGRIDGDRLASAIERDGMLLNYYIPQDDLDDLYAACDCVLIPYRGHTGTSGVLVNAAASSRPVIAPDYAVIGDLVRGNDLGYLYKHLNVADLSRVMEQAAVLSYEPSDRSRDYVNRNTPEVFTRQLGEFFFRREA